MRIDGRIEVYGVGGVYGLMNKGKRDREYRQSGVKEATQLETEWRYRLEEKKRKRKKG